MNICLVNNLNVDTNDFVGFDIVDFSSTQWKELDNGEIDSLVLYHLLDSLELEESQKVLQEVIKKVAINGTLLIVGYELGFIKLSQFDKKLFNQIVNYIRSLRNNTDILQEVPINFELQSKSVNTDNNRYYLVFRRIS